MVPLLLALLSKTRRHHVPVLLGVAAGSVVIGGSLFAVTQHVSVGTGLYWAVVTAATVGYGDVTPHDAVGRVIAVAVILTTIPMLAAVFALVAGFAAVVQIKRLGMERDIPEGAFTVVYGAHPSLSYILEELVAAGREVALVADLDPSVVNPGVRILSIAGDPTNEIVIRRSHPERAANALVLGTDDGDVLVTCVALRAAAPELPVLALAGSPKIAQALRDLGVQQTLSADQLVAHTLAKSLEAPHAGDVLLRLIDSERYRIVEVPVGDDMVGRPMTEIEVDDRTLMLGLVRDREVTLSVDEDGEVRAGDILVVLTTRR